MHKIVKKIEKYQISYHLVTNADQTPLNYVPIDLALKSLKNVPFVGTADKWATTATFAQTLDGSFLPVHLIYKEKTSQSLPKITFPDGFHHSANEKHFSNIAILMSLLSTSKKPQ